MLKPHPGQRWGQDSLFRCESHSDGETQAPRGGGHSEAPGPSSARPGKSQEGVCPLGLEGWCVQEPEGGMLGPPGQQERETSSAFQQLHPRRADRPRAAPHSPPLPTDLQSQDLLSLHFPF